MSSPQPARREYVATLVLLVVAGALGLVAAGQTWGKADDSSSLSAVTVEVTGGDLVPLASAVSLVALASVVAVPALRRVGRRIVGGVLVVLGAGLAVTAAAAGAGLEERVRDWVASSAEAGGGGGAVSVSAGWAFAAAAAGLLVALAGALVAVRGPSWPGLGAKYERPSRVAPPDHDRRSSSEARDTWDALDRGDDPTA